MVIPSITLAMVMCMCFGWFPFIAHGAAETPVYVLPQCPIKEGTGTVHTGISSVKRIAVKTHKSAVRS